MNKQSIAMRSRLFTALLIAGLFLAHVSCSSIFDNDDSKTSGIEGTVVRGPMCPVVREDEPCPDEPFAAAFHVFQGNDKYITTFQSDEQGHFRVALDPGEYTIVPDESAPILFPTNQKKTVVVNPGDFTEVTLQFDTGIR